MRAALLVILIVLSSAATASAQGPVVHAHRGGSVVAGVPTFAEETMPAFRHAWLREGAVLELDVKLTSDRVPVVIHDDTLERTTTCEGPVSAIDVAAFKACRGDLLGSGGTTAPTRERIELATLDEALAFARDSGATVNLEIKNIPGENDFDPSRGYADTVIDAVVAARFPVDRLIVQSFWPANLDVAGERLPGLQLSFLTLQQANEGGPEFAASRGWQWVSPAWPLTEDYVRRAHGLGLKVVPYTLNAAEQVKEAARIGVDALITDDVVMARRALGRPEPPPDAGASRPVVEGAAPAARLLRLRRSLRVALRRGWLTLRVRSSEPATVELDGVLVVRRAVRVRGGTTRVAVRLTRAARRTLRHRRAAMVRVAGRAVFAGGGAAAISAAVRLR